ncbi:MAG: response regulator [Candidatus Scalindua sp.]|nr:response regulator [Candidatus Scalindua sp.]
MKNTILVVDDTASNVLLLSEMLSSYTLLQAADGEQALSILEKTVPDLILLDIRMPEMNGFELCRKIKRKDNLGEIPVIFISALTDTNDKVNALQCGGVDYITIPFHFDEVKARIKTHLEIAYFRREVKNKNFELEQALLDLKKESHARILVVDELRKSEERYRTLVESSRAFFWEFDISIMCFTYVGEYAFNILGYPISDWYEENFWQDHMHKDDKDGAIKFCTKQTQLKNEHCFEYRMIAANGRIVWIYDAVTIIDDDREKPVLRGIMLDITERKVAEDKIRKLSHAIEQSTSTIVITDINGNIEYVNPWFASLTGYSREETIGKNPRILRSDITPPEVYEELWSTIKSGKEWKGEFCNIKKNGDLYWESASISAVKNDQGVITNFIAVKNDITESKKMRKALLESEKFKSLGIISAGIAHEFNNILAVMVGNAELLKEDDKELKEGLDSIIKAGDDGAEIVRNMLKYAKPEGNNASNYTFFDINKLINEAIEFSKPRWRNMAQAKGVDYKIDKERMIEVPDVLCNTTELREVFTNIINNALDAMPNGGTISFSTWNIENNVLISISDTGMGMTEDVKKKIFDPFFTTRRPLGTGLGMSVSYGVIMRHNGSIEIDTECGKGTTLNLRIPIRSEIKPKELPSKPEAQVSTVMKRRILIVDDNDEICAVLKNFLIRGGHDVKTVNNGAEAIELVREEDFDLVLCDLAMPNVYGYDVIKAINKLDRRPKIGIITGWEEALKPVDDGDYKIDFTLKKPFKHSVLNMKIKELFI